MIRVNGELFVCVDIANTPLYVRCYDDFSPNWEGRYHTFESFEVVVTAADRRAKVQAEMRRAMSAGQGYTEA